MQEDERVEDDGVRSAMMYVNKRDKNKIYVIEMRMLRWNYGVIIS